MKDEGKKKEKKEECVRGGWLRAPAARRRHSTPSTSSTDDRIMRITNIPPRNMDQHKNQKGTLVVRFLPPRAVVPTGFLPRPQQAHSHSNS